MPRSSRVYLAEVYADESVQIAAVYDQDGLDPAKARDSFVRAGDWYKQEDANALVLLAVPVADILR